ncbi:MAG: hypothetical protein IJ636_02435 [Bacteroidales bacterium]|nr:hypothetical protein [Bacteroidales bacterium]
MKAFSKHITLFLGIVLAASCTKIDYPDRFVQTDGVPTIDFIRYADKDVIITQANMEEVVCIVGDNLTSVHDLYFNDQAAVLNSSYMTDHTLVVSVPKNMPAVQTDKIYLRTKSGAEVTYDFKVLPPAPKLTAMSLEWAQPGQTVTIYGSYLFAPLTIEFPGVDPVEISSSNGSSVDVVVPEGAQPGKIKVNTASGTAQSVFMYKDSRGMLFDFDGLTGLDNHGWNGHNSQDADEHSISGRYFQFGDGSSVLNDDTWDESHYSFVYWPGSWNDPENYSDGALGARLTDFADFSDWKNMALKFEMCIPSGNPWTCCALQICMAGVDKVSFGGQTVDIYGNQVAGANNTYMTSNDVPRAMYRPWLVSGSYDTGDKWITVTIPFTEFTYGWDGNPSSGELNASSFTSLWMFVCQGGIAGTEGSPVIRIDNIRAVPYK